MGAGEDLVLTVTPAGARVVVSFPDSGQGSCSLREEGTCVLLVFRRNSGRLQVVGFMTVFATL